MTFARFHLRPTLIAVAAIVGASLVAGRAAHGSTTGRGTCDPRKPSACCVGRPETCTSGCCPSRASAPLPAGLDETASGLRAPATGPACNAAACQCRSSEPADPREGSDRRTVVEGSEGGAWAPAVPLGQAPAASPLTVTDPTGTGRPKVPLYLLTTHLRF